MAIVCEWCGQLEGVKNRDYDDLSRWHYFEKSLRLGFSATNNEAEYKALLARLIAMRKLGGKTIKAYCDLRLVVGRVKGNFEAKDPRMLWYLNQVKRLVEGFHSFLLEHVPSGKNSHADSLATLIAMSKKNLPRIILV